MTKDYSIPSTCNTATLPPEIPWLPELNPLPTGNVAFEPSELPEIANADYEEISNPDTTEPPMTTHGVTYSLTSTGEFPDQFVNDDLDLQEIFVANDTEQSEMRNVSHLTTFVDVDHDLDFPDGLEGNIPVSVLPPGNISIAHVLTARSIEYNISIAY